jgi:imidazolonepropionase-like amidohydrolase/pimeloyl-ACP methyl ester carboxylesterase
MLRLHLALVCLPFTLPVSHLPAAAGQQSATVVLYQGARLITGESGVVIQDSAFLVRGAEIVQVGTRGAIRPPQGATVVSLSGKTVMPAVIDAHSHLGYTDVRTGDTGSTHYTRDNLLDHLRRYAYYGIAATLSLGLDRGELPYELRAAPRTDAALFLTAGRGIAMPNAGPNALYWRDAAYGVTSEVEAREAVRELAARKVDIVKIWVDDRNKTVTPLPPSLYRPIIEEAHARGLRVVAHVYYLTDAKELLRAGVDGFAHGIRDLEVDEEIMQLFRARPEVFVIPNLPDTPPSIADLGWLSETLLPSRVDALRKTAVAAPARPRLFDVQARSLARLAAAGVRIGFGTDAGVGAPYGWSAHAEMVDMVAAGMTPLQVIVAATRTSAEIAGLAATHGRVAAGMSADFIVLDANPLDDIRNTRRISQVYLRGAAVDRARLSASWRSPPRAEPAPLPGVRLWFTDTGGPGEPVVFLHANTGTSESWEPQIDAFARAGYRVIAFDRRGWGRSVADPTTGPQPGRASDDLHALADYLKLDRFHLVGVAGGGFVALDYAASHTDRLLSLVVGASTGSVSDREVQDVIARIEIPGIRALPAHYREVGASYRGTHPEGTARWLEIHERARQPGAPAQPLRSPNTYAKLATISVRTLVVAADADLLAPPGLMKLWARHVRDAQWTMVADAGHSVAWEQPAVFNEIVLQFLAGGRPFPDVPQ